MAFDAGAEVPKNLVKKPIMCLCLFMWSVGPLSFSWLLDFGLYQASGYDERCVMMMHADCGEKKINYSDRYSGNLDIWTPITDSSTAYALKQNTEKNEKSNGFFL
jgi:hypothetical protein